MDALRDIRKRYGVDYTTPLGTRNRLTIEATYKPQLYARDIKLGKQRVPRQDHRWNLAATWERSLRENLLLVLGYDREGRQSNDREKEYGASRVLAAFTYRF